MNFSILEDISNKLKVLTHSAKTYYSVKDDFLYIANRDNSCVPISEEYRKKVISFYNQVHYQNTVVACESCREKRLREIDVEFSKLLSEIKFKYC